MRAVFPYEQMQHGSSVDMYGLILGVTIVAVSIVSLVMIRKGDGS